METLKCRYNQGKRNNLYCYRDSNGNEIDILYTKGQDILPIEVKSGQTITSAYFLGLKKICALFPDRLPWQSLLVYGGETEQLRQDTKLIDPLPLQSTWQRLTGKDLSFFQPLHTSTRRDSPRGHQSGVT